MVNPNNKNKTLRPSERAILNLQSELEKLEKRIKILKVEVLKTIDVQKISKVSKFIKDN